MHNESDWQPDAATGRWEFGPRSEEDDGLADLGYEAALPGLQSLCASCETPSIQDASSRSSTHAR
jgi:hypothetical protein